MNLEKAIELVKDKYNHKKYKEMVEDFEYLRQGIKIANDRSLTKFKVTYKEGSELIEVVVELSADYINNPSNSCTNMQKIMKDGTISRYDISFHSNIDKIVNIELY